MQNEIIVKPKSFLYSYRTPLIFIFGLLSTVKISLWAFRESFTDLFTNRLPLSGDGTFTGVFLEIVRDTSYLDIVRQRFQTSSLGWPNKIDFTHFPVGNTLDLLGIKIIFSLENGLDVSTLIHIVSILKVILIYGTTFLLCRKIKLNTIGTLAISILYPLSSYNLIRSEGHFFLGLTWTIPLGILLVTSSLSSFFETKQIYGVRNPYFLFILATLVGYSSFYYSFFFLVIFMSFFFLLLFTFIHQNIFELRNRESRYFSVKTFLRSSRLSIIAVTGITVSVVSQLLPVLIQSNNILTSAQTSDRSFTEPIVYSGNLQSLFFDFSRIFLYATKKEEILNFLRSQISWEGSQTGSITGIFLLAVLLMFIVWLIGFRFQRKPFGEDTFLLRMLLSQLVIAICLYFPGPLNFVISMVFPQIRGWGRISTLINLLVLIIVFYSIQWLQAKKSVALLMTLAVTIPGLAEIASFRLARPPSSALNDISRDLSTKRAESLFFLRSNFGSGCSIAVLPISPFPEFDNPNDSTNDYSFFDLPLADKGDFQWVNGAFKNSWDSRFVESLYSQQPNFVRTSISFQLDYFKSMGVCGAVIDLTALVPTEKDELGKLQSNQYDESLGCLVDVPGEHFIGASRFKLAKLTNSNCNFTSESDAGLFWRINKTNGFVWRIDSPYAVTMKSNLQIFAVESSILLRFKRNSRSATTKGFNVIIRGFTDDYVKADFKNQICFSNETLPEQCLETKSIGSEQVLVIPDRHLESGLNELSLRIKDVSPISHWGIYPISDLGVLKN